MNDVSTDKVWNSLFVLILCRRKPYKYKEHLRREYMVDKVIVSAVIYVCFDKRQLLACFFQNRAVVE